MKYILTLCLVCGISASQAQTVNETIRYIYNNQKDYGSAITNLVLDNAKLTLTLGEKDKRIISDIKKCKFTYTYIAPAYIIVDAVNMLRYVNNKNTKGENQTAYLLFCSTQFILNAATEADARKLKNALVHLQAIAAKDPFDY